MAVTKVVMPKLSDAMESGKIIKWLKKEGDKIQGGDILAEVETDKADVEMEAFGAGVLRKILVPAGESAAIGALIGVIAEPGEDIAAVVASAPAGGSTGRDYQRSRRRSCWRRAGRSRQGVAVGEEDCGADWGGFAADSGVGAWGAHHSAGCRGGWVGCRNGCRGCRDAGRRCGGGVRRCSAHADAGDDRAPDALVQGAGASLLCHE